MLPWCSVQAYWGKFEYCDPATTQMCTSSSCYGNGFRYEGTLLGMPTKDGCKSFQQECSDLAAGGQWNKACYKEEDQKYCDLPMCNDAGDPREDPIDCQLSIWGQWGDCSQSCGGGFRKRTRSIKIAAQYGGKKCEDNREEEDLSCNTNDCPLFDCSSNTECSGPDSYVGEKYQLACKCKTHFADSCYGGGRKYGGDLSRSQIGNEKCMSWKDVCYRLNRFCTDAESNGDFCRQVGLGSESVPYCFVDKNGSPTPRKCDVPKCDPAADNTLTSDCHNEAHFEKLLYRGNLGKASNDGMCLKWEDVCTLNSANCKTLSNGDQITGNFCRSGHINDQFQCYTDYDSRSACEIKQCKYLALSPQFTAQTDLMFSLNSPARWECLAASKKSITQCCSPDGRNIYEYELKNDQISCFKPNGKDQLSKHGEGKQFCEAKNKRLCTESELQAVYSVGNSAQVTRQNYENSCKVDSSFTWTGTRCFTSSSCYGNGGHYYATGILPECASWEDVCKAKFYHIYGNLCETYFRSHEYTYRSFDDKLRHSPDRKPWCYARRNYNQKIEKNIRVCNSRDREIGYR